MQKLQKAFSETWIDPEWEQTGMPLGTVCELIYCMSSDFQSKPELFQPQESKELWISFPQSSLQCDAFLEDYGPCLVSLSGIYEISLCGFAGFLEEAELRISHGEEAVSLTKNSVSGKDFDVLSAVWLKIKFQKQEESDFVRQAVAGMELGLETVAVCGRWAEVLTEKGLTEKGLFENREMSYFRYLQFGTPADREMSMLASLSTEQLRELWVHYFTNGKDTLEFELFFERLGDLSEAQQYSLMAALRLALLQMHICVDYSGGEFRITDAEGARIWLDFASRCAAEKLFLKLLFPIAVEPRPYVVAENG